MPSYDNDLVLTELATGEGSGTWGDTTNLNLELIGEAFSYGTGATFDSDSNKIVAKKYGANTPLWTKRITFVIDEKGYIQKIYRKINVNTHAEKILSEIN